MDILSIFRFPDIIFWMSAIIFFLGMVTFILGVIVLATRTMGKDIRDLATHTSQIAQKGITNEISGLVGNASMLMNALQELVKTTTGIGLFLILIGILMMAGSYWLFSQYFEYV